MATIAGAEHRTDYRGDQAFFVRMAQWVALFIVFAFIQWSARGFVDFGRVPIWVHLHGAMMVAWLGLFVVQNRLADSGSLALHRRLGWSGLILALLIAPVGCYAGIMAVALHRGPPFFPNGQFLALTLIQSVTFAATVTAAVLRHRDTEWHRRLMLAALVVIMEPAFGRLLSMPLLGGWGEWLILALQLGVLGIAMRHDRRIQGAVHPGLLAGAGIVAGYHVLVAVVGGLAPVIAYAEGLAAG